MCFGGAIFLRNVLLKVAYDPCGDISGQLLFRKHCIKNAISLRTLKHVPCLPDILKRLQKTMTISAKYLLSLATMVMILHVEGESNVYANTPEHRNA